MSTGYCFEPCPQCGNTMAMAESNSREAIATHDCYLCGYAFRAAPLVKSAVGINAGETVYVRDDAGRVLITEEEKMGHGAYGFTYARGCTHGRIITQVTDEVIAWFVEVLEEIDADICNSYLTVWDETARCVMVICGTLPAESGTLPAESGTLPAESGTLPAESGTLPAESGTTANTDALPRGAAHTLMEHTRRTSIEVTDSMLFDIDPFDD